MSDRRRFIQLGLRIGTCLMVVFSPLMGGIRRVVAATQRILLPQATPMESLIDKNPSDLDTRDLDITPLDQFDTMGIDDLEVDIDKWRLELRGRVKKPLSLSYRQLKAMPSMERKVLLICPGFFAYHARWKGISMGQLLDQAQYGRETTHITISGPNRMTTKSEQFSVADILADKVFLAYGVNGTVLPQKHGYPLRLVAEDYYGGRWVKYVDTITVG